jgi:AraC-like DNA-binding protein
MGMKESDLEKIRLVAAILEKEHKYHYTHQQLALKVGTNESHLRVAFKQIYNITISAYLREIRVSKAKELLENTEWSLNTIASHIGFKDASIFIKNFKKSTGLTPLKWRVMQLNNPVKRKPDKP